MREYQTHPAKASRDADTSDPRYARIRWLNNQFTRYEDYWWPEIQRLIRNQKMFWGINFGQWPSYVVEKLKVQGRRPPTLNIIGKKIESKIGSYLANGFDIRYKPVTGMVDSLSVSVQDMYLSDKADMDWEFSEIIAMRDGFNMVGYERMIISDKNNEWGNVDWEAAMPQHVYLDPAWKTYDPDDIRNYFEWGKYFATEIVEMWPESAEMLKETRDREEAEGMNLGEFVGGAGQHYRTTEQKWGDRHTVMGFHHVEIKDRWWEYDLKNRCDFPETGFKPGSQEDRLVKTEYIKLAGLDPESDVTMVKQKKRIKKIEMVCPTLVSDRFIAGPGKDRIQTNNCNIYPFGNGYNGQYKGDTDDMYDIQISFNKGIMNIEDIQMRTAKGAFVLDSALAGGDETKQREIEAEWNNPAARIWVDDGTTSDLGPNGGIIELPSAPVSADTFRQNDRYLDLADWLSSTPAAMDSRTESAGESGKLYRSKVEVAIIGQKYGTKLLEFHKKAKARAYPKQAKITYAGWPREFHKAGGKETFAVNERGQDSYGRRIIINDMSLLPEQLVTLQVSPTGTTMREEMRHQHAETLPMVKGDPEARLALLVVMHSVYDTYEMSEDNKEELDRAFHILKTNEAMMQTVKNLKLRAEIQFLMNEQTKKAAPPGQQALPAPQGEEIPTQSSQGEPSQEQAEEGTSQQVPIAAEPQEALA